MVDLAEVRILLIEDNPGDARLLHEAVRAEPCELVWAKSLTEGLERLEAQAFDVVLLDLGLPDSSGLDTFVTLCERAPQPAVVVLSGMMDQELAVQAVRQGAQDYLVKGQTDGAGILRALRYALERQRAEGRIRHMNACLQAIRRVNQLIARQSDRETLLQGACDEIRLTGEASDVWLLLARRHRARLYRAHRAPVAVRAPRSAVHGLPACISQAMAADGPLVFIGAHAACTVGCLCDGPRGAATVMVRLRHGEGVFGVLGVQLRAALADDEDEQNLFEELAGDLARALHSLEAGQLRRKAQRALRQEERKFRTLFEHANDALFIHDVEGRILEVNRVAADMLGYRPRDLRGRRMQELEDEGHRGLDEECRERLQQRGHSTAETMYRTRDGSAAIPVELRCTLIRYRGGTAVLTSGRDLTARKQMEETQRLASLGQLAAGVAHEYNNVLAAMSARAQTARAFPGAETTEDLIEAVLRLARRGCDVGHNLMAFARPRQPEPEVLSPEEPIEAALQLAENELLSGEVEVVRDYRAAEHCIYADRWQMQQVLLNVIINACHAMPGRGRLTLETFATAPDQSPPQIVIRLQDNGAGIPPEHLPRVFEPFFSTKGRHGESERPGAGLGLFVSRGLVQANGGTIILSSQVGQGTACEIRLPEHACPALAALPQGRELARAEG